MHGTVWFGKEVLSCPHEYKQDAGVGIPHLLLQVKKILMSSCHQLRELLSMLQLLSC